MNHLGKKVEWLKGIIVPVVTPFDDDENLNEKAFREIVDFLIDKGVNCLFPLGATSEFHRLSLEEKKKVIDIVVDQANGRIMVMPGTHSLSTKLSIEIAKYAEDTGADAICLLQPYGMGKLSDDQLYEHFKDVGEAVNLPMMVYSDAGMVNELSLELVNRIADLENTIGIKLSTLDFGRFQKGVKSFGDRIAVCTGEEFVYLFGLMVGGTGGTIGTANMIPEYWVKIYDLFTKGKLKEALETYSKFMPVWNLIEKYGFREVTKEALNIRGVKAGRTRRPGTIVTSEASKEIRNVLMKLGITL